MLGHICDSGVEPRCPPRFQWSPVQSVQSCASDLVTDVAIRSVDRYSFVVKSEDNSKINRERHRMHANKSILNSYPFLAWTQGVMHRNKSAPMFASVLVIVYKKAIFLQSGD